MEGRVVLGSKVDVIVVVIFFGIVGLFFYDIGFVDYVVFVVFWNWIMEDNLGVCFYVVF